MGQQSDGYEIGLALSGGGYRATLYSLGSLWRLNELGYLRKISIITSVSGGSITSGVLGRRWGELKFENDVAINFKSAVADRIQKFCKRTIDVGSVLGGLISPFYSISNRVAKQYNEHLFKGATLQDLPDSMQEGNPRFIFYATSLQSGASVRMSRTRLADYKVGQINNPTIPLAEAVAASSAFPPVLSPAIMELDPSLWSDPGGAYLFPNKKYRSKLYLTDGGVYDNMGLEKIWDTCRTVLLSDAGAPLKTTPKPPTLPLQQTVRVMDIITDQTRALRKRKLISDFQKGERKGTYWGINTEIDNYKAEGLLVHDSAITKKLSKIRTRLNKFSDKEQERLINWGYALADAAMRSWVDRDAKPGSLPFPNRPLL